MPNRGGTLSTVTLSLAVALAIHVCPPSVVHTTQVTSHGAPTVTWSGSVYGGAQISSSLCPFHDNAVAGGITAGKGTISSFGCCCRSCASIRSNMFPPPAPTTVLGSIANPKAPTAISVVKDTISCKMPRIRPGFQASRALQPR